MSAAAARTVTQVDFSRQRPQKPTVAATARVPRVAKTLALAHRIDAMIAAGELKDYADAARHLGWSRARVSQVMNLLLLAPPIQEAILDLPMTTGRDVVTERKLRPLVAEPVWERQIAAWHEIAIAWSASSRVASERRRLTSPGLTVARDHDNAQACDSSSSSSSTSAPASSTGGYL